MNNQFSVSDVTVEGTGFAVELKDVTTLQLKSLFGSVPKGFGKKNKYSESMFITNAKDPKGVYTIYTSFGIWRIGSKGASVEGLADLVSFITGKVEEVIETPAPVAKKDAPKLEVVKKDAPAKDKEVISAIKRQIEQIGLSMASITEVGTAEQITEAQAAADKKVAMLNKKLLKLTGKEKVAPAPAKEEEKDAPAPVSTEAKKSKARRWESAEQIIDFIKSNEIRNLTHLNDKFYGAYAAMIRNGWKEAITQANVFTGAKPPKVEKVPKAEKVIEEVAPAEDEVEVYVDEEDETTEAAE